MPHGGGPCRWTSVLFSGWSATPPVQPPVPTPSSGPWRGSSDSSLPFFFNCFGIFVSCFTRNTLPLTKTLNNAIDKASERFLSTTQRGEAKEAKKRGRAAAQNRGYQVGGGDDDGDGFQFMPAVSSSSSSSSYSCLWVQFIHEAHARGGRDGHRARPQDPAAHRTEEWAGSTTPTNHMRPTRCHCPWAF